jgi:hypothetical protein
MNDAAKHAQYTGGSAVQTPRVRGCGMAVVEILYFAGCPGHHRAIELVRDVAAQSGVPIELVEIEVRDDLDAKRLRFLGSPSIRVDGCDVEAAATRIDEYRMSCRLYRDGDAVAGVPAARLVRDALQHSAT